jgi:hypothetical protein
MKIEGSGKTPGAGSAIKTDKKRSADGAFGAMVDDAGETPSTASVARPAAVGALDALLTLQSVGGEEGAKKARQRATDLLDQLERIKMGLLTGELPQSALQQLARTIATHRERVMDPRLAEILDEIDLRAQVELAKLGQ